MEYRVMETTDNQHIGKVVEFEEISLNDNIDIDGFILEIQKIIIVDVATFILASPNYIAKLKLTEE